MTQARHEHSLEVLPEFPKSATDGAPPIFGYEGLGDLDCTVEVPLGRVELNLRALMELRVGSVLPTDRLTGESLEILVNGTPIARGEVRVHGERFAVRVTEILGSAIREHSEGGQSNAKPTEQTD